MASYLCPNSEYSPTKLGARNVPRSAILLHICAPYPMFSWSHACLADAHSLGIATGVLPQWYPLPVTPRAPNLMWACTFHHHSLTYPRALSTEWILTTDLLIFPHQEVWHSSSCLQMASIGKCSKKLLISKLINFYNM